MDIKQICPFRSQWGTSSDQNWVDSLTAIIIPVEEKGKVQRPNGHGRPRCEKTLTTRGVLHFQTRYYKIIQVHIHKGDTHYVAECIDLPVVTQAKSLHELVENIKEAIALHLEDEDLSEFDLDPAPSILASFELERLIHVGAVKRSTKITRNDSN